MSSVRSVGPADSYIRFYEAMSPETMGDLAKVASPDVHFRDPFNDVTGIESYQKLLVKMFEAVPDVKFTVSHQAVDGNTCFIRWRMTATLRGSPWVVEGMSELKFAPDGKVRAHIDYWDAAAQFYEKFPMVGPVIKFIRRRVARAHQ